MGNESSSQRRTPEQIKKDRIIQAQQETIHKQQWMIVQQQSNVGAANASSNRNRPVPRQTSAGGASTSSLSFETIDNFNQNVTSNAINGRNVRFYGEFRCPSCKVQWKSDNARMGVGRECKNCHISVYPTNLRKIYAQPGTVTAAPSKVDNSIQNNLNNPNAIKKCDNKPFGDRKERMLGEFKCTNCKITWKATYYGNDQQCNKCKSDVAPSGLFKQV